MTSIVVGTVIMITEILILTNYMDYSHPEHNAVLILQFMIFMGVGSALILHGIKRDR